MDRQTHNCSLVYNGGGCLYVMDWDKGQRRAVLGSGQPELVCNRAKDNHMDITRLDDKHECPAWKPDEEEKPQTTRKRRPPPPHHHRHHHHAPVDEC